MSRHGLPQGHLRQDLGIEPPTTFAEMIEAAAKNQDAGAMKYPIALPWLATADIGTSFQVRR